MKPTCLLILLYLFAPPASAQFGMPSYKEVKDYFFTHGLDTGLYMWSVFE